MDTGHNAISRSTVLSSKRPKLPELYMKLIDRKRLLRLMAIQGVSQRQLAHAAGYKSHAYMGRIMRGEVETLETEPAVRIAKHLGVGTDDLFLTRLSTDVVQIQPSRSTSGRRKVS